MRDSYYWSGWVGVVLLGAGAIYAAYNYWPGNDSTAPPGVPVSLQQLHVGLAGWGEINTLDPAKAATAAPLLVVWQMYDRLVRTDEQGALLPQLAASWTASADLREWRFRIRTDATFHSPTQPNRAVTPRDVKGSIERAVSIPGYGRTLLGDLLTGADAYLAGSATDISGIRVEGSDVVFHLTAPFAFLPERLATSFFSIVPAGTPNDSPAAPPGSGPYVLVDWDPTAQTVRLTKAQRPYDPPSADSPAELLVRSFQTEGVAVEELRKGTIQWLEATSTALPLVRPLNGQDGIAVEVPASTQIRLVALNTQRIAPELAPILGRALNQAVNRDRILDYLGGGQAVPGPVPDYSAAGTMDYDPVDAKQQVLKLPAAARRLTMLVQPGQESQTIAEILKEDWEKAGLSLTLKTGLADFFTRLINGDYELALAYYGPFLPIPEQYLWPYRAAAQPVPNVMRYDSKTFDSAFDRYVAQPDTAARAVDLRLAVGELLQSPPCVWVVRAPWVKATRGPMYSPRVAGTPEFYKLRRTPQSAN